MREPLPIGQELRSFSMADGRVVEYILDVSVDTDLPMLVYHHGTPGAGPIDSDLLEPARAAGFRTVELVRPGYGGTRMPGRTVSSIAALTDALADHFELTRFASTGWSGGGPHALGDAALLPRCVGALCIAGIAPYDAEGLVFLDGMGQDNLDEFGAAQRPAALEAYLTAAATGLSVVTTETVRESLEGLLAEADVRHLEASTSDLAAELRWSTVDGIWGWYDDDIAFVSPWGFDLQSISKPVIILQGTADLMVPVAHGEWLARHVPTARAEIVEGEGHLSVIAVHVPAALDALIAPLR